MLSCFSRVHLFATPWTVARQAPLSVGLLRQEHWSGSPCSLPEDLPNPGMESMSLMSPALAAGFFTSSTPGKPRLRRYLTGKAIYNQHNPTGRGG